MGCCTITNVNRPCVAGTADEHHRHLPPMSEPLPGGRRPARQAHALPESTLPHALRSASGGRKAARQAPAAPGWRNGPPPVRSATATAAPPSAPIDFLDDFPDDDTATSDPSTANGSLEVGPGTWEAPPVRGAAIDSVASSEAPPLEPP